MKTGSALTVKGGEVGMKEAIIQYNDVPDSSGGHMVISWEKLVRCKDCGFGEACKNGRGEHGVMCYNSHSASHGWVHEPDWFCADGERDET